MAVPEVVGGAGSPDPLGNSEQLEDERRLVECARTDRAAFAQLYRCHVGDVYRFAYRRCGSRDVAEEATSATFEHALRAIEQFEWRGAGIRPWLLRIASNEVAEIYRRRSRVTGERGQIALRALTADERVGSTYGSTDGTRTGDDTIDRAALHRALNDLPERYRNAITLRYLAGMSADDAARELGWTKAVLAVTLHRGLKALRSILTQQPETVAATGCDRQPTVRSAGDGSVQEVFREANQA